MKMFEHFSEKETDILKARAKRIASISREDDPIDREVALAIEIGSEKYALPIKALKAVYEDIPVIPVPCVPPYVAGIANIRGHIIPVLSLSVLLNAPDTDTEHSKLVVAANDVLTAAFQVEKVGEVINFTADEITVFPAGSERANYLQGVLVDGTGLLNIDNILDDPMLVVDERIA